MESESNKRLVEKMDIIVHHFSKLEISDQNLTNALQSIDTREISSLKNELSLFPKKIKAFNEKQESNYEKIQISQMVLQECIDRLFNDLPNDGKFISEINFGEKTSKRFLKLVLAIFLGIYITISIGYFGTRYYKERPYKKAFESLYDIPGEQSKHIMKVEWEKVNGNEYKR
ncbi:hypothetical protein [uncultured Marixanthomonas sp.]|uniref:hypothetical protein n=1 Tax=uncultured Marixanthomonas sp. TaxID=757245 RepID=UPI0030D74BC5|tara:strand:- start:147 stop:662 length:516 start_codon:yes stop_codon:yes gene_type:complete